MAWSTVTQTGTEERFRERGVGRHVDALAAGVARAQQQAVGASDGRRAELRQLEGGEPVALARIAGTRDGALMRDGEAGAGDDRAVEQGDGAIGHIGLDDEQQAPGLGLLGRRREPGRDAVAFEAEGEAAPVHRLAVELDALPGEFRQLAVERVAGETRGEEPIGGPAGDQEDGAGKGEDDGPGAFRRVGHCVFCSVR